MNVDDKDVHLSLGMAAAVEIKTATRKLIEFVLSPLMRMGKETGRERCRNTNLRLDKTEAGL